MTGDKLLAASIITADFAELGKEIDAVVADCDWLHLDVMDGHFVPNITFGVDLVRTIRRRTSLPLDVHLMVSPVQQYLAGFAAAGADNITIHLEAEGDHHAMLAEIRRLGCKAGLAINPDTSEQEVQPYLEAIDLVVLMSVYPGFGGQQYIPATDEKIARMKTLRQHRPFLLAVDGGIGLTTIAAASAAGADILISGSAIFAEGRFHPDNPTRYRQRIIDLRQTMIAGTAT